MLDLLSRPHYRLCGLADFEAIKLDSKIDHCGQAPYLFTTGPWRGETVWCNPDHMDRHLSVAAKYYQCSACGQLIVPGEIYAPQVWAPWECHPDGDKMWFAQPACRWCMEGYWKSSYSDDGWWEQAAEEWAHDQAEEWLRKAEVDYLDPPLPRGWLGRQVRDEFTEPLSTALKQANAFMAFLRRFAKGAKPATIRRVGPALLAIGFRRPPEGGLDHMLSTCGFPGEEWWRCEGCNEHPCDCTCPHYNTPGTECCGLFPCDCECEPCN